MATVLLHSIKDGLCLEAGGLKSGSCNVASLCVLGDTKNGTLCIINPVGGEQARESSYEDETTVVVDGSSEFGNLFGMGDETL